MLNLRHTYTFEIIHGSQQHSWTCIGGMGGLNLRIRVGNYGPAMESKREYTSGLEIHHRNNPGNPHDAPTRDDCWLLQTPCWHDGSSAYAEDYYLPRFLSGPHDHEEMFRTLSNEYRKRFVET